MAQVDHRIADSHSQRQASQRRMGPTGPRYAGFGRVASLWRENHGWGLGPGGESPGAQTSRHLSYARPRRRAGTTHEVAAALVRQTLWHAGLEGSGRKIQ